MKLAKIELAEFSAAARLFPSKVIQPGGKTADGKTITDISMDELGHVWLNRGEYVLPATSLVYWRPVDAEAEWSARFDGAKVPPGMTFEELMRGSASPMGMPPPDLEAQLQRCPTCGKVCASPAGLAAHMRGHK
jgi:hypothetical protein